MVGEPCQAKWDDEWLKGQITEVTNQLVEVIYVDYGNLRALKAGEVRVARGYADVPILAVRVILEGIGPSEGQTWSHPALDYLQNRLDFDSSKFVHVKTDGQMDSLPLRGQISLRNKLNMNERMVKRGYAKKGQLNIPFEQFLMGAFGIGWQVPQLKTSVDVDSPFKPHPLVLEDGEELEVKVEAISRKVAVHVVQEAQVYDKLLQQLTPLGDLQPPAALEPGNPVLVFTESEFSHFYVRGVVAGKSEGGEVDVIYVDYNVSDKIDVRLIKTFPEGEDFMVESFALDLELSQEDLEKVMGQAGDPFYVKSKGSSSGVLRGKLME